MSPCVSWLLFLIPLNAAGPVGGKAGEDRPKSPSSSESKRQRVTLDDIEPDTSDIPDSAFTVPRGAAMYELSLTRAREKDATRTRMLSTTSLIRVGLAPKWELRLSSDGLARQSMAGAPRTHGVGDLVVGFKRHLSPGGKGRPALGIIGQTSFPTASAGLSSHKMEQFLSLNIDHPVKLGSSAVDLSVNLGGSWLDGTPTKRRFFQRNVLWVVATDLIPKKWGFFVHGASDFPAAPGAGDAHIMGPGLTYRANDFTQLDFSFVFGVTPDSTNQTVRLGFVFVR